MKEQDNATGLRVWGERRPEPDWDGYLEALLHLAMRKAERREVPRINLLGDL